MKKILNIIAVVSLSAVSLSCSKYEDEIFNISKTNYSIYTESQAAIEGTCVGDFEWESLDEYVATISGTTIKSNKVGTTTIRRVGHEFPFISVEVLPKHTFFTEPEKWWGCLRSAITSKYGTPDVESNGVMMYETDTKVSPYKFYSFENGRLKCSAVLVDWGYAERLVDFLAERYVIYDVNYTNNGFTADFAHVYGKQSNHQIDYAGSAKYDVTYRGIMILYFPVTIEKKVVASSIQYDKIANILKKVYDE